MHMNFPFDDYRYTEFFFSSFLCLSRLSRYHAHPYAYFSAASMIKNDHHCKQTYVVDHYY